MKKSDSILKIIQALIKAQSQFKIAKFDKTNPHFKSKYASLNAVLAAVEDGLQANGLAICNLIYDGKILTTLFHESGEWLGCEVAIPTGISPQEVGKAITYFRRYSVCCLLSISTGEDEDDDGNSAEKAHNAQKKESKSTPVFVGLSALECIEIESLVGPNTELKNNILRGYGVKFLPEIESRHFRMIIETLKKRNAV